jgi:DMSO/TMAO reductase YedYZ molybdopterin-dependent catalytic subunit
MPATSPGTTSTASPEPDPGDKISSEELRLAARNHGMPLEALRWAVTPVGLHYLLVHYDIPMVDPATWSLTVDGHLRAPSVLSLDDLRARPAVTVTVTLECAGNGRALFSPRPISQPWLYEAAGTARWTGTPLRPLLEEAGILGDAVDVLFTGLDHGIEGGVEQNYQRSLTLAEAFSDEPLLAYEMNGQPLPPQHGAPLRLVVPGWYGMASVKWLSRITVLTERFEGYQQTRSYVLRAQPDEAGTPVNRMMPRALMVPPGFPDFMTRQRTVRLGPCRLEGRAWSGWAPIERVEVSTDGARSWQPADLGESESPHSWMGWSFLWEPERAGIYELSCRATDALGQRQPLQSAWNTGGYVNNAVQRVPVTVTAD